MAINQDQDNQKKHHLLVCTTCASIWQDGKRTGVSGGEILLEKIRQVEQVEQSNNSNNLFNANNLFSIEAVQCMSACSHACAIALTAPDKYTYVFGDLPVDQTNLTETVNSIFQCADLYAEKKDGLLGWSERPPVLQKGLIARIPPISLTAKL